MTAAQTRPAFVKKIETDMEIFLQRTKLKQYRMPVMKAVDRKLVHELASKYGIASVSEDPEPNRSVVLYKVPTLALQLPRPKLSEAAKKSNTRVVAQPLV